MENIPNFEVIIGTYEEYLLGYQISLEGKCVELKQSFATHEHSSSIRTVSSSGKFLASGAADDRIVVYDMVARKEHIMLTHHDATVNCVEFTAGNTHLISSSIDGVLAITRVGNWQLEKIWERAHKGASILAIAVHPTGKLALTLGSDATLHTWNLIKGRKAYIINLNSKSSDARSLTFVKWAHCGEHFVLGGGTNIEIWSMPRGGIFKKFKYSSKVTCVSWLDNDFLAIGHENGKITVLNVENEKENIYEAHSNRVKCLQNQENYLVTASSSGEIKIWIIDQDILKEVGHCSTGCRTTCIAIVNSLKVKKEEQGKTSEIDNVPTSKNKSQIVSIETEISQKVKTPKNKKQQITDEGVSKSSKQIISVIEGSIHTKKIKKLKILEFADNEYLSTAKKGKQNNVVKDNTIDTKITPKNKQKTVPENSFDEGNSMTKCLTKKKNTPFRVSTIKKKINRHSQTWAIEDV